jgi:predicted NAD/FAD-binding protein
MAALALALALAAATAALLVAAVAAFLWPRAAQLPRDASRRRRVAIVGAGAAGMSAAWALSREADAFEVTLYEREAQCGGVASTMEARDDVGASVSFNDQVQGGTSSYHHCLALMEQVGAEPTPLDMKVVFGLGPRAWTNTAETPIQRRMRREIARFGRVLRVVSWFEPLFVLVPIGRLLGWLGFSVDFSHHMLYPLCALFFGTGVQTHRVSASVIARVFFDDDLRLFDYDADRLLSSAPRMFAFPPLREYYERMRKHLGATVLLRRRVTAVERDAQGVTVVDETGARARFDDVVLACDAESALRVLGMDASRLERAALGNVEYYDDPIHTHQDHAYMARFYGVPPPPGVPLASLLNDEREPGPAPGWDDVLRGAQYLVRTHERDKERVEMSFNLSAYQPTLKGSARPVYQTIFAQNEIDPKAVIHHRLSRHNAHTWRHFAFTVPLVRFLQGARHTWYCGAYLSFNTHEMATISGLAAAYRLGARYPFPDNAPARKQFATFLSLLHGVRA